LFAARLSPLGCSSVADYYWIRRGSSDADTLTIANDISLTSALPAIIIKGQGHLVAGNHTFGILTVNIGANLTLNEATIRST
jgi:hypothetical protein